MQVRFGAHQLDLGRRELRRDGEMLPLEPQVFDLLVHLISNRDRVISKDELIQHIWGGRIVSDSAIDSRVKALRHALGDDGTAQRLIRTIPRKGLRFVGSLSGEAEAAAEPAAAPSLALPDKPSIAVLPFTNMSSDPEQEFFADGLTEDITTALARLDWLFVIARNSAFTYKGRSVDMRDVGRDLGVRYLLEGSIRSAGGLVRITGQLIEAATATHIWAGRYDRPLRDFFAIQDEITESVVATIEPHIYLHESGRAQSQAPESMDAWGCVAQAIPLTMKMSRQDNQAARALLDKAIGLSPGYARAHAVLAWAEWWSAYNYWPDDSAAAFRAAGDRAERAVSLDPREPWARMAHGLALSNAADHVRALAQFETALAQNPSFALCYVLYGMALVRAGQADLAVQQTAKALRISPVDTFLGIFHAFHGFALMAARRFADAMVSSRQSLAAHPDFYGNYNVIIACCGYLGLHNEARSWIAVRNGMPQPFRWGRFVSGGPGPFAHYPIFAEGLRLAGVPE